MRSELSTLPDGIAAQHGHLVELIRQLRAAHAAGTGWEELAGMLDTLLHDFDEHFSYEELIMDRGGYPRLDEHKAQHAAFLGKVHALRRECDRRETELMGVLVELLETWLRNHEKSADRDVARFLKIEL